MTVITNNGLQLMIRTLIVFLGAKLSTNDEGRMPSVSMAESMIVKSMKRIVHARLKTTNGEGKSFL